MQEVLDRYVKRDGDDIVYFLGNTVRSCLYRTTLPTIWVPSEREIACLRGACTKTAVVMFSCDGYDGIPGGVVAVLAIF